MDCTGFEVKRRCGVDLVRERIEPGGPQLRRWQFNVLQRFHQIAEHGALSTARGLDFFLQLLFVIGFAFGAHDNDREVLVVIDRGDDIVRLEHVLIEEIAERQIFGMVTDRHRGDDLLGIEEDRQCALDGHRRFDPGAGLIDAGHAFGQARILRIRADEIIVVRGVHGANVG